MLLNLVQNELMTLEKAHLLRIPRVRQGIDFASNDYLGLSKHPELPLFFQTLSAAGSTGSRLLTGHSEALEALEASFAKIFQAESALCFSSGYLANLGFFQALGALSPSIYFFSEAENHASLIDALRSHKVFVYRHLDLAHLKELIHQTPPEAVKVIVTESLFGMSGEILSLSPLLELAEESQAFIFLDEAHATGTLGDHRLGLAREIRAHSAWARNHCISLHTGGKALGGTGAFLCLPFLLRSWCLQKARTLLFSTAPPLFVIQHLEWALEKIQTEPERFETLQKRMQQAYVLSLKAYEEFSSLLLPPRPLCPSPLLAFRMTSLPNILALSEFLFHKGFDVRPLRFPTVPLNRPQVRISLKAFHTQNELENLFDALFSFFKSAS